MSKDLVELAKSKSRAIPTIVCDGDVIVSDGPLAVKIVKKENDRIIVSILGDFKVNRNLRGKK